MNNKYSNHREVAPKRPACEAMGSYILKVDDETLHMTMLFDFFGDLLTDKQREYFDLYHNEDLSLSEIAEKADISRQGVYDIITRAEKSLVEMEQKTGVVSRWRETRIQLEKAELLAKELLRLSGNNNESADVAQKLVQTLESLTQG